MTDFFLPLVIEPGSIDRSSIPIHFDNALMTAPSPTGMPLITATTATAPARPDRRVWSRPSAHCVASGVLSLTSVGRPRPPALGGDSRPRLARLVFELWGSEISHIPMHFQNV